MIAKARIRALLAAFAAAGSVSPLAAAFGIGLQPASVEVEADPGARTRQVVTLANTDHDKPISLSLSLMDWTLDPQGGIELSPAASSADSAAAWARVNASTVTLGPGQSKQVRIDLAVPEDLARTGGYRFALLASSVLPDGSGGWKKHQTASLFYLTAGEAESRPGITGSRLAVTAKGAPAIGLDLTNPGSAHARLEGTIEIRTQSDEDPTQTMTISDLVVLNGGSREIILPLDAALPANPVIDVYLTNAFAPQARGETEALPPYRVETELEVSALTGPAGGLD